MSNICVLGAGMVGRTIAVDLKRDGHDVTCIDINQDNLDILNYYDIKIINCDLVNSNFEDLLKYYNLIVSAVPGSIGYKILKKVIIAKKNCIDISFFPEDYKSLNNLAIENSVLAIVDCGVAPGMSNLILGAESVDMDISDFKFYVGGLPLVREWPFEYKAPFSPMDVIEEYIRPVRMRVDGIDKIVEPLTDTELIEVKSVGTLEGFNTDGLRSLLDSFPEIPNMIEKTLRYPGYVDKILLLKKCGFFDDEHLENTSKVLLKNWKMNSTDKDFTYMLVEISGYNYDYDFGGEQRTIRYEMLDFHDGEFSSMSRTTAYTCTSIVELFISGKIKDCGVIPPEFITKEKDNLETIMYHLRERGIKWQKKYI